MKSDFFDREYFENGVKSGKSLYEDYKWLPELTIPLAQNILDILRNTELYAETSDPVLLDYGCAKGFLVKAFRCLNVRAFGIDLSEYAVNNAPLDVKEYTSCIDLLQEDCPLEWPPIDCLIAKDVLEHIPKNMLPKYLSKMRQITSRIFVVVPLGNGQRYYIKDYEQDPSHYIKEDLVWWKDSLNQAGFDVTATYEVGDLKKNWKNVHPKGNGLLYTSK